MKHKKITKKDLRKHWLWETGGYTQVMTLYTEHINDKPSYIIVGCGGWDLSNGWRAPGVCFWGKKENWKKDYKNFVYPDDEVVEILNEHKAKFIDNTTHVEVVPHNEERPPVIMRQLFGRMAECEKDAGFKQKPWQSLPDNWKEVGNKDK